MLAKETQDLVVAGAQHVSSYDHLTIDLNDDGTEFVVTVQSMHRGNPGYSTRQVREWADDTPGAKACEIPGTIGNSYYMPVGFITVLRLMHGCKDRITFVNDDSKVMWDAVLAQFAAGVNRAKINAAWSANQTVPEHSLSIDDGIELLPFQEVAAQLAVQGTSFAFFMEQGTGKTPTAIATMCTWLQQATKFQRIVIVCPRNVIYNWAAELKAFASVPIKVETIRGSEIKRIGKLARVLKPEEGYKAGIAIVNYDTVMTMQQIFMAIPWDIAVLDECHFIKGPQSQRTKFFVGALRDKATRRLELTGTPIANTPMDLWSQLEFLGPATSGFATYKGYRDFYARIRKNQATGFDQIVGMQHVPVLQEVLARNAFIITKKAAMPWLPEKQYRVEEVEMSPAQVDLYRRVATELAVEIEHDIAGETNKSLLINNVLTKLLRLSQVTSAFIKWDAIIDNDGNVIRPPIIEDLPTNPKVDWCVQAIKDHPPDEKILFWSWMTHDIDALSARLDEEGIDHVTFTGSTTDEQRREAERLFNCDPRMRVFIGNPAAGGTGLNLLGHDPKNPDDYATDATMSVYIAQNWNAVHRSQSEDRNHRRGTRKPIQVVTLVCPETIDEDIHERVTNKRKVALEISDIRALLTKILGDLV